MPNGLAQIDVEVAEPAIMMGTALFSGMGQRVAWEVSTPLGFITTGGLTIGGLLGSFFLEGLGKAASLGLANSGITLVGWLATEQFLLGGAAARGGGPSHMMDQIGDGGRRESLNGANARQGNSFSALEMATRAN